jgi:hypothetical protein
MTASAVYPGDEQALCHIIPLGDFKEHEVSRACWCHPRVHEEHPDVILHNAMDQRDKLERGEIRLQ